MESREVLFTTWAIISTILNVVLLLKIKELENE